MVHLLAGKGSFVCFPDIFSRRFDDRKIVKLSRVDGWVFALGLGMVGLFRFGEFGEGGVDGDRLSLDDKILIDGGVGSPLGFGSLVAPFCIEPFNVFETWSESPFLKFDALNCSEGCIFVII